MIVVKPNRGSAPEIERHAGGWDIRSVISKVRRNFCTRRSGRGSPNRKPPPSAIKDTIKVAVCRRLGVPPVANLDGRRMRHLEVVV